MDVEACLRRLVGDVRPAELPCPQLGMQVVSLLSWRGGGVGVWPECACHVGYSGGKLTFASTLAPLRAKPH